MWGVHTFTGIGSLSKGRAIPSSRVAGRVTVQHGHGNLKYEHILRGYNNRALEKE